MPMPVPVPVPVGMHARPPEGYMMPYGSQAVPMPMSQPMHAAMAPGPGMGPRPMVFIPPQFAGRPGMPYMPAPGMGYAVPPGHGMVPGSFPGHAGMPPRR
mmetsp:Transcript_28860/g.93902  ORF Transcript_28860/g.93902 Transcript_28860/m.93902 type:complete len:100 (+) Transcript_28860:507-806(+)